MSAFTEAESLWTELERLMPQLRVITQKKMQLWALAAKKFGVLGRVTWRWPPPKSETAFWNTERRRANLERQIATKYARFIKLYAKAGNVEAQQALQRSENLRIAKNRALSKLPPRSKEHPGFRFNPNVKIDRSQVEVKWGNEWITLDERDRRNAKLRAWQRAFGKRPH